MLIQRDHLKGAQGMSGGTPLALCAVGQECQHPANPADDEEGRETHAIGPAKQKLWKGFQQSRAVQHGHRGFRQHPGIAIGGLAPGRATVDQHDAVTGLLQGEGVADADNAAADDRYPLGAATHHSDPRHITASIRPGNKAARDMRTAFNPVPGRKAHRHGRSLANSTVEYHLVAT